MTQPAILVLFLAALAACSSQPKSVDCTISRVEFDILKQRVKSYFRTDHMDLDADCDSVANSTFYSADSGCLIRPDRKPLASCPDKPGDDYVVAFDRATLTPIDVIWLPKE